MDLRALPAPVAEAEPPPQERFELRRGALWEDVIHGGMVAGVLGALLFPSMGAALSMAGVASVEGQARGFVLSLMLATFSALARTRVSSRVVIDPEERAVHDAVRLGRTVYLQGSTPWDLAEAVRLVRRERQRVLHDQRAEERAPIEARGELVLGKGRALALTDWIVEEPGAPPWEKLVRDLRRVAATLELEIEESAQVDPPVWELGRIAAWATAISFAAGVLVIIAAG
jgi:hypothetical protein